MLNNSNVTMTTVELAELTGKAHNNVLRDARKVIEVTQLKSEQCSNNNQVCGYSEATYRDGRMLSDLCWSSISI